MSDVDFGSSSSALRLRGGLPGGIAEGVELESRGQFCDRWKG